VGGTQKFLELLKKMYLKYLYKFETLVPFKVLPLRMDAAIPAPLPMPETFSKIFNGNARWWPLTGFLLKILDDVSGTGISASSRRGSTLKGTKVSNLYKYFK
jgi:hypothetical protein